MEPRWTEGGEPRRAHVDGSGLTMDGRTVAWPDASAITQLVMRDGETQSLYGSLRVLDADGGYVSLAAGPGDGAGWGEAQIAVLRAAAGARPDLPFRPLHDRPETGNPALGRTVRYGGTLAALALAALAYATSSAPVDRALMFVAVAAVTWFAGGLLAGKRLAIPPRTVSEELARREAQGYGLP